MTWITIIKPTARRFSFGVLVIAGVVATVGCGQNASQTSPVTNSGGTAASISHAAASVSGTATAISQATATGGGGSVEPPKNRASGGASTACPTQGEGGDNLPPLCAPPPSPVKAATVSDPATPTPTPPPSPCHDLSVESVSPSKGAEIGGDIVTIKGTGFSAGEQVYFGSEPAKAVTVESDTEIAATTPPGPASGGPVEIDMTMDCSAFAYHLYTDVSFTYETPSPTPTTPTVTPSPVSPDAFPAGHLS
jgi:IPT/TIG domain